MESTRRFKPPWTLIRENSECYVVRDANGVTVAWLYCRDDSQRYSVGASKLTSSEARRIGKAISRIPEFMTQRQGFHQRGGGPRWRDDRPYHVALEDTYIRAHWAEIDALCRVRAALCSKTRLKLRRMPMQKPPLDPDVDDTAPTDAALTVYDEGHIITYLRMLDADAAGADWRKVARVVLHIDPDREPDRARHAFDSHLARAKWMTEHGYRHLLRGGALR